MILNCPSCIAQFYVDKDVLGDKGRKVKCMSCGESWMQRPENYEESDEIDRAIENLEEEIVISSEEDGAGHVGEPAEVEEPVVDSSDASDAEEEFRPSGFTAGLEDKARREKRVFSFIAAAAVFFITLFYLLLSSSSMMQNHPSTQAFYALFGMSAETPGHGLIFDKVVSSTDGGQVQVQGKIVNLGSDELSVPQILASVLDSHDVVIEEWLIEPSQDILPAEGELSFEGGHEGVHITQSDSYRVVLRFVMDYEVDDFKIVAEGGEDSQSHHQDENDHQSDHAMSEGSHPPASSGSHQEPSHPIPHHGDDQVDHDSHQSVHH